VAPPPASLLVGRRGAYEAESCFSFHHVNAFERGHEPTDLDFVNELTQVDVEIGESHLWTEPGAYPREPVFIPSPELDRGKDDGVLLSVVLDGLGSGSYLLVLDARSLEEIGRARVPHDIPFGFHGQYFS
jgi:carotenoid cleavage dioxygenase-like enzyme